MHKSCLLLAAAASFALLAQAPVAEPDEKSLKDAFEKAKSSPADSPQFAKAYRDLADFYCSQSRYGDAEPVYAKLLEEREHAFGLNSGEIVPDITELARVNFAQMKFGAADTYWRRALQIVEQTVGKQHKDLVPVLENLARAALAQDKAEEGSKFLRRALAIREKLNEQRASDLLQLAATLNMLGRSYTAEGKESEAEASFVRALRTVEKAGGNALELSTTLDNLGGFYLTRQKYEQAEPALRRALAVRESSLGPVDPAIAPVLDQLGAAYNAQKKYPEGLRTGAVHSHEVLVGGTSVDPDECGKSRRGLRGTGERHRSGTALPATAFGPGKRDRDQSGWPGSTVGIERAHDRSGESVQDIDFDSR
jgi:tetratricopeptide (TPR) repeat protein